MPDGEDAAEQTERLADGATRTRAQSSAVMARLVRAAKMCAETEDQVAATLEHVAETQPHRAAGLRAKSAAARANAAQERRWVEGHEPAAGQQEGGA